MMYRFQFCRETVTVIDHTDVLVTVGVDCFTGTITDIKVYDGLLLT
jgi:hypothetical protein